MAIHLLTARQVEAASAGDHADGGGLVLKVNASHSHWLFRFTGPAGVRRAMGLGAAHCDTIAAAGRSLTTTRITWSRCKLADIRAIRATRPCRTARMSRQIVASQII